MKGEDKMLKGRGSLMTFDEYTAARRSRKWGIAVDDEAITRFVASQPTTCPTCGAKTRDPFGMGVVIHDIARCASIGTSTGLS